MLLREPRRRRARAVRDVRLQHRALVLAVVRRQAVRLAVLRTGRRCWWRCRCPATAQRFFQAFLGDEAGPPPLSRARRWSARACFYTVLAVLAVHRAAAHDGLVPRRVHRPTSSSGLYLSVFYLYRALPRDAVARREDAPPLPGGRRLRHRHVCAARGAAARAELRQRLHHRLPLLPVAEPGPLPAARPERAARPDGGARHAGVHPGAHLRRAGRAGSRPTSRGCSSSTRCSRRRRSSS